MDEATSDQAGTALREVRTPVARRLADAVAELHDVLFARHAVEELLNSWPAESTIGPDTRVARSLWTAALVTYARCFCGGVRQGTAKAISDQLSGLDREIHDWAIAMRSKHFAHSVNAFELARVGVSLGPPPEYEVLGLVPMELFTVLPDRQAAERFAKHTERVHLLQVGAFQDLESQVLEELRSWTAQKRSRLPGLELTPAGPQTDPSRRR